MNSDVVFNQLSYMVFVLKPTIGRDIQKANMEIIHPQMHSYTDCSYD